MRRSWTTVVPPVTVSHGLDVADIEYQIHCIETEAYSAVLRAFTAQSDVLTWDKEGLISNLRKELRVSNIEHRELLVKVDSDDCVRMIREWRNGIASQNKILSDTITPSVPGSVGHSFDKRREMSHVTTSSSLNYLPYCQPGSAISSSLATHFRESQLGGEAATSFRMGSLGQRMKSVGHDGQTSLLSKGRGPVIDQQKKNLLPSDITNLKKSSDIITIRATDRLIREVERLTNGEKLDSVPVEKAKLLLREHEREILEALDKLSHVSDNDDSLNKHGYSHQERKGRQKIKLRLRSLPSARV